MMKRTDTEHVHGGLPSLGVLITNLGSPDSATVPAVRRYLKEFLWDPRVVEIPRPLWWLILHAVVLPFRPSKTAHAYQQVWTADGSPLVAMSKRQKNALQRELAQRVQAPVHVALGMRYGNPSIANGLRQLRKANVQRLLVLPLYPQYSAATTATAFDALAKELADWRWVPELRTIGAYHDDPAYIKAVADSIREYWRSNGQAEYLLFSFHGMPKRTLLAGDPYHCQCHKTARLVAEELQLAASQWMIAFQSRFGREEWLKPYAQETLQELPKKNVKSVDVVCPGFSADCLETLEEMALRNRDFFIAAGGQQYRYIPCLNDRPDHIQALADIIVRNCGGWSEANPQWDSEQAKADAEASRRRAIALGAAR